jgi:hypothetical protein
MLCEQRRMRYTPLQSLEREMGITLAEAQRAVVSYRPHDARHAEQLTLLELISRDASHIDRLLDITDPSDPLHAALVLVCHRYENTIRCAVEIRNSRTSLSCREALKGGRRRHLLRKRLRERRFLTPAALLSLNLDEEPLYDEDDGIAN